MRTGYSNGCERNSGVNNYEYSNDFYDLVTEDFFVDKSLFISEFLQSGIIAPVLKRPSGWGKSSNLNMLQRFLELSTDENGTILPTESNLNRKLFVGGQIELPSKMRKTLKPLQIFQHCPDLVEKYQGQYPVISIGFGDATGSTYSQIEKKVKQKIVVLFDKYRYLLNGNIDTSDKQTYRVYLSGNAPSSDLKVALLFLSRLLYRRFDKEVYILIDDYDTPIYLLYLHLYNKLNGSAIFETEDYKRCVDLFSGIVSCIRDNTRYCEQGLINSIAPTSLFQHSLLDERLFKFIGFNETELKALLSGKSDSVTQEIKNRYCGYTFSIDREPICKPISIVRYLKNEQYSADKTISLIDDDLLSDWFQPDVIKLIIGESIEAIICAVRSFDQADKRDRLISLLLFFGYLNPIDKDDEQYRLSACNDELRNFYELKFVQRFERCNADCRLASLLTGFHMEQFAIEFIGYATRYWENQKVKIVESTQRSILYGVLLKALLRSCQSVDVDSVKLPGTERLERLVFANEKNSSTVANFIIGMNTIDCEKNIELESEADFKELLNNLVNHSYYGKLKKNTAGTTLAVCLTVKGQVTGKDVDHRIKWIQLR